MNSIDQLLDFDLLGQAFSEHFDEPVMQDWLRQLPAQVAEICNPARFGDLPGWLEIMDALPDVTAEHIDLSQGAAQIGLAEEINAEQQDLIEQQLMALKPWRKGPFDVFGIHVDTEWRSDWKWQRVSPSIDLKGKRVLDIGCGNGYYALRMLGEGAKFVLGVDPSPRFIVQYNALKRFFPAHPSFFLLPVGIEHLPASLKCFDVTFSMGVFYHRRSPIDHLLELRHTLRPGGELILETLVVEGDEQTVLVPEDRYAMMRNVWYLPSVKALALWMRRAGFKEIEVVDVSMTSVEEQRSTPWMQFHSLSDFLDPKDHSLTVEGYPAPMRAVLKARCP